MSKELVTAVDELRTATRNVPTVTIASMQARRWHRFRDNLRVLENEARHLTARLESGAGHDETHSVYARMWVTIRDLREDSRRMMIPQQMQAKIDAARAVVDKLDAFYS